MNYRTDLACEARMGEGWGTQWVEEERRSGCRIERMEVTPGLAKRLGKAAGRYVTVEMPPISDHIDGENRYIEAVSQELARMVPERGLIFVVGLGNPGITADALGPRAAGQVLATRHITGELGRILGEKEIRAVAVASPDVLGNTGMESIEVIRGLTGQLHAAGVIAIDALASRSVSRLGCTVQLSDAGIAPGSGIGNHRPAINEETVGVPVIGMGIPTVVDAMTLAMDVTGGGKEREIRKLVEPRGAGMIVTPREIDLLIERAARLLGMSVNCALNAHFTVDEFSALVN